MGFMTFTNGSVLTATQVNDYLMKQANIVCTSGTRPSSPIEGMTIYETDTDDVLIYTGAAWKIRDRITLWAYKTGDTTRTSTTSSTDDPHLTVATVANRVYELYSVLMYSADAAVDIKVGWMATGTGARCLHTINGADIGGGQLIASTAGLNNPNFTLGGFGTSANTSAVSSGLFFTGSTSGVFSLAWAQQTSSGTGSTMRQDSYFVLRPIV